MNIAKVTPWLLHAPAAYRDGRKGEYIFVEVNTDEGVTGWGEVTTTYPVANRAICAVLQQIGVQLLPEKHPVRRGQTQDHGENRSDPANDKY